MGVFQDSSGLQTFGTTAASLGGSVISAIANSAENRKTFERQKILNRQKYEDYINYMRELGATPTSMISGLSGSAGSVPGASVSNNPVPDLGSAFSSAISADASQRQASAAVGQASAALTQAETERQLALMRLKFEPAKYFADIRKSLAEAFESTKHAFLHGSMKQYYDELTKDVQQVRPWKLAGLRQGLLNDMATFNKIVQETRTSKAEEGYYKAGAYELQTRGDFNKANTEKSWAEAWNEHLRGFRIQWENTLLAYGIDPSRPFWENTGRLMISDPKLFKDRMSMFVTALNTIDGKLQENLGDHYKRNIALGYGLFKLNQIHQKNANSRSYRFSNGVNAVSKMIPILGGDVVPVPSSTSGVDWWMKD